MAALAERAWPGGLPVSGRDMAVRREAGLVAKADARRNASASHAARTQGGGLNATLVLIGIGIVVPNLLAVAALACDIGLPPRPMRTRSASEELCIFCSIRVLCVLTVLAER